MCRTINDHICRKSRNWVSDFHKKRLRRIWLNGKLLHGSILAKCKYICNITTHVKHSFFVTHWPHSTQMCHDINDHLWRIVKTQMIRLLFPHQGEIRRLPNQMCAACLYFSISWSDATNLRLLGLNADSRAFKFKLTCNGVVQVRKWCVLCDKSIHLQHVSSFYFIMKKREPINPLNLKSVPICGILYVFTFWQDLPFRNTSWSVLDWFATNSNFNVTLLNNLIKYEYNCTIQ